MELIVKTFDELNNRELLEILKVRAEVFVVEQSCPYCDPDDTDSISLHLFYRQEGRIIAYMRAFEKPGEPGTLQLGRVLTVKRGVGLGGRLLHESLLLLRERLAPKRIFIEAQCYAAGFYEREGFKVCSGEFHEDGIPHVGMELNF